LFFVFSLGGKSMSGEKQNESKFLSMLERRGIVRKVAQEEDSAAGAAQHGAAAQANNGSNLNAYQHMPNAASADIPLQEEPLYDSATGTQMPEASSEWYPSDQTYESPTGEAYSPEYSPEYDTQQYSADPYAQNVVYDEAYGGAYGDTYAETYGEAYGDAYAETYGDAYDESSAYHQTAEDASSRDPLFAWMENEEATSVASPADDSTGRYLEIEELYELLSLQSKKTDTIFLIEDYINSIPDSLPDESRRQIISKIVAASGFDYDLLMGDGILRVKMLKEYAEKFARHTDDYVEARMAEIAALESELGRIQGLIEDRRELHKKQFLSIEAEAGRLREILTFING
jgi:hypothetical protein